MSAQTDLGGKVAPLVERIFIETGLSDSLKAVGDEARDAVENVKELINAAAQYDQDGTTNTPSLVKGCGEPLRFMATTGEIESVVTEATADGAIQWYCRYIPASTGATVAAATT